MGLAVVCGTYFNTFFGMIMILLPLLGFLGYLGPITSVSRDTFLIMILVFFYGIILVVTDKPFFDLIGRKFVKYSFYRGLFWLNPSSSLDYISPAEQQKMELELKNHLGKLLFKKTMVGNNQTDPFRDSRSKARDVETQLQYQEAMTFFNNREYDSALSKLAVLLEMGYLSLKEKLTIKSLMARRYFQINKYEQSYSMIKDVLDNRTKLSAKI